MTLFKIFMAVVCVIIAIIICVAIIRRNYDRVYERTPVAYYFFAIGISQILIVTASYLLFEEWWQKHEWLAITSVYFSIACGVMYGIIEFGRKIK